MPNPNRKFQLSDNGRTVLFLMGLIIFLAAYIAYEKNRPNRRESFYSGDAAIEANRYQNR